MQFPTIVYSGHWRGGHCQGIAVDTEKGHIYYSFTTMLVKTDLAGRVLGTVTGLLGHLGCIAWNAAQRRVYGSLEYKQDSIGKGILADQGSDAKLEDGFYIAIFAADSIDRVGMDAAGDGVMTSVFLRDVLEDYKATVDTTAGPAPHRWGCSGIDGTTFAPIPGPDATPQSKKYLFVAYGIYSDVDRTDNDHQVLLAYDIDGWGAFEQPLRQESMHRSGPAAPDYRFFVRTGNTTYGVQNLEYDAATGHILMAVYPGKKPGFANRAMLAVNGSAAPVEGVLEGVTPPQTGLLLAPLGEGWQFPEGVAYGDTGLFSFGDGRFYISHHGKDENGWYTHVRMYRWDCAGAPQPCTD